MCALKHDNALLEITKYTKDFLLQFVLTRKYFLRDYSRWDFEWPRENVSNQINEFDFNKKNMTLKIKGIYNIYLSNKNRIKNN